MTENRLSAFLNYAKKKKWDASLIFWNGKYIAILNPVNNKNVYEGESKESIDDAINNCKIEYKKRKKK